MDADESIDLAESPILKLDLAQGFPIISGLMPSALRMPLDVIEHMGRLVLEYTIGVHDTIFMNTI